MMILKDKHNRISLQESYNYISCRLPLDKLQNSYMDRVYKGEKV